MNNITTFQGTGHLKMHEYYIVINPDTLWAELSLEKPTSDFGTWWIKPRKNSSSWVVKNIATNTNAYFCAQGFVLWLGVNRGQGFIKSRAEEWTVEPVNGEMGFRLVDADKNYVKSNLKSTKTKSDGAVFHLEYAGGTVF
eukprot:TRINITY_DN167_c0_g1_i1.p1 TRINITY_DN167_c0_g1~~TRINITY_DN167_c0_g1_i1.p1  ORF type:complete len:140 (+),score=22.55 TRINITY_DN167_c0_g1_i1:169-588(+)